MFIMQRRVTGFSKQQKNLHCEDATYIKKNEDIFVMACADGHGDRKCKYAERGAELASRILVSYLYELFNKSENIDDYGSLLNENRQYIMQTFVCKWVGAILDDYKITHPEDIEFANNYLELAKYATRIYKVRDEAMPVKEFRKLAEMRHSMDDALYKITLLYGTTINAVVMTKKFVFAIGIGDGDVIAVNGKRVEWLLPYSEHYSTSTASMSNRFDVIMDSIHAILIPISRGKKFEENRFVPDIVMISTDGLRNSFWCDEAFIEKILEIAALFRNGEGYKFVKSCKKWADECSKNGLTQDDISFCLGTKFSGDIKIQKGKR